MSDPESCYELYNIHDYKHLLTYSTTVHFLQTPSILVAVFLISLMTMFGFCFLERESESVIDTYRRQHFTITLNNNRKIKSKQKFEMKINCVLLTEN